MSPATKTAKFDKHQNYQNALQVRDELQKYKAGQTNDTKSSNASIKDANFKAARKDLENSSGIFGKIKKNKILKKLKKANASGHAYDGATA
mgnify:CR=1 FL=1